MFFKEFKYWTPFYSFFALRLFIMLSILKTVLISCVLFLQLSSSVIIKRHGLHGLPHLPRHITAPKRLSTRFLPPTSPDENSQDGLLNTSSEDDDSSDEDGDDSGQDQDDEGDGWG
jgi:hypothetical protein